MSSFSLRPSFPVPIFPSHPFLSPRLAGVAWRQDCALCVAATPKLICAACEADLGADAAQGAPRATAFDEAIARFEYRFPVDRLVQRFKYGGDLAIGRWLAERLAERVCDAARPDLLAVPPLAAARLRERGFNQALEIARTVGKRLRVPVDARAVERRRDTPPQASLDRRARAANLRGAFACGTDLRGRHVAIVDDVLTTGATADAIARVLKAAGAERVSAWAVARAHDPGLR
jgi:ComF family protein